jgi:hypothetical protein
MNRPEQKIRRAIAAPLNPAGKACAAPRPPQDPSPNLSKVANRAQ